MGTLHEQGEDYFRRREGISQSLEPSTDSAGAPDFAGHLHCKVPVCFVLQGLLDPVGVGLGQRFVSSSHRAEPGQAVPGSKVRHPP